MVPANSKLVSRNLNSIADLVGEEVSAQVARLLDLERYLLRNYDENQWDATTRELLGLPERNEE